jgi:hypothetical protein
MPVRAITRGFPNGSPAGAAATKTVRSPAAVSETQATWSVPRASTTMLGASIMSAASAAVSGTRPITAGWISAGATVGARSQHAAASNSLVAPSTRTAIRPWRNGT